jgi:hypothetical protein
VRFIAVSSYSSSPLLNLDSFVAEDRLVINDDSRRQRVIESVHNTSHPGINRTLHMVASKYYWPGLTNDCEHLLSNIYIGCIM